MILDLLASLEMPTSEVSERGSNSGSFLVGKACLVASLQPWNVASNVLCQLFNLFELRKERCQS